LESLHKINNIRNVFAHEMTYVDGDSEIKLVMDQLTSNGKYNTKVVEKYYDEFQESYKIIFEKLTKFQNFILKESSS